MVRGERFLIFRSSIILWRSGVMAGSFVEAQGSPIPHVSAKNLLPDWHSHSPHREAV
jgi:hypothetical protein